jgi:hypothetical protein
MNFTIISQSFEKDPIEGLGVVVYTCNHSYEGGRGMKITVQGWL